MKFTGYPKLISGRGETQSQSQLLLGKTQRKERVFEIEQFYDFTGYFSKFSFGHDLKHRCNSKELTMLLLYLPQMPSGNFPYVWLWLSFPDAKGQISVHNLAQRDDLVQSRFSDWGVLKLTNCGQMRHLVRNKIVDHDLESNRKVGWEVMMDHIHVETMSQQTHSW